MIDRPYHKGDAAQELILHQSLRRLPDGWYEVTVTPKARAATAARGYLHGCVMPIYAQMLGEFENGATWPDDEAWERAKKQFRPREYVDRLTGQVETVGRSTKGMTPRELFEFTQLIIDWIHDNGGTVPAPDRNWKAARERAMQEQKEVA